MAKKALSIRPRPAPGADANPRPGQLAGGRSGARQAGAHGRIDWPASLRNGRPQRRADLVLRARSRKPGELWLVIVDASASTRRHGALTQAKGLLADTFEQAYRQRTRLAVLHATGAQPRWFWQGQKVSSQLQDWLEQLGAGGGTPLIEALQQAREWLGKRQRQKPGEHQRLLVLTDGRLRDWPALQPLNCPTVLVDIEGGAVRLGRARKLAEELDADYRQIGEI
ncbi:VWA domain-containing protein [Pseudomonas sp. CAN2814]|uniref:vWA domain-containing protein n=1 Tax=Pseudomonas sp. CAN1 TaxID=3046726 RepID=UPI00264718FB|nr:VWA domain-containing protein [Pseudomonas sp. CAN1]MDN6856090.1 VWA domain-containing protein [Pseudomonas sp. CAN1]